MMRTNTPRRRLRRAAAVALAAAAIGTTAACSDFLVAENPGAIEVDDLNQVAYVSLLANAPVGALQNALDDMAYWNGQFTDELVNRNAVNPFIEEGQIDRRELRSDMSYLPVFIYSPMQRARFLAEDATTRLGVILGDSASRDVRVARSQAYAGYAYIYLGETMCTTPINVGVPKPSSEMFGDAIGYFDDAIATAEAAKAYQLGLTPPGTATATAADSVRWLSLVGAARAALNRNDKAQAIAYASQVPANFVFHAYYSANTSAQHHRTYNRLTLGNNATLGGTPFEAMLGDPRVPRTTLPGPRLNTPLSPPSYSTYNGLVDGAPFAADMSMRMASGLEARYIVAEAEGPTDATLAFVNERRAAGGQAPVALSGDELMAELRDQRARDFYLDNHRLGDLRRYLEFYGVDLFPKGAYPGTTTGQVYDEDTYCWPLPISEINDNPNVPR